MKIGGYMYRSSIIKIALISLLFVPTTRALEKQISFSLGVAASLVFLAYTYTQSFVQPIVKMKPEHTDHSLLFSLYTTTHNTWVGSISANYYPSTNVAVIESINVVKEYREHGYGIQLWNTMIDALKKYEIRTVTWKVVPHLHPSLIKTQEYYNELDRLIAWYKKRGGRIVKKDATQAHMQLIL